MNYYNDNDKGAVKWIKYLIRKNLIPKGEVDDRDIREIEPRELDGFTQCHFFAGIGGWSYALQLAGWPADRPVWTGSCPCQPFSVAGQGRGIDDERHLWPSFRWLIAQCRPATVFGEQVASRDGREWLAGVRFDMEAMDYAVGAADLCAASVGAPHIRQRLWWVAHAEHSKRRQEATTGNNDNWQDTGRQETAGGFISCGAVDNGVSHAPCKRQHGAAGMPEQNRRREFEAGCGMVHTESIRSQGRQAFEIGRQPWRHSRMASCRDGKQRRIPKAQSAFPVVADGLPGRVALLRGIGNSIVPQVAAQFIMAHNKTPAGPDRGFAKQG